MTICQPRTIAPTWRQRMKPYIRWMLLIAVLNWFFAWLAWDSGLAPVAHSLMLAGALATTALAAGAAIWPDSWLSRRWDWRARRWTN
jgi:hypothetical protein